MSRRTWGKLVRKSWKGSVRSLVNAKVATSKYRTKLFDRRSSRIACRDDHSLSPKLATVPTQLYSPYGVQELDGV
jgi:hypothetical protein